MTPKPVSSLAGLALLASRIACLIVLAAFVVFVVNQTNSASVHQQNELNGSGAPVSEPDAGRSPGSAGSSASSQHESSLHRTLDETANTLTSPFAGVVSESSEWVTQLVRTGLALLVYGLGVAFLVRFIRVRV